MNFKVLESFKAKTSRGEKEIQAGQVITLPKDKALNLLNQGKIAPISKMAYRVYSEILQAHLWVVETDQDMHSLRSQRIHETIYTGHDVEELKKLPKNLLKAIHSVKEAFPLSSVEEITNEKEKENG
jgi:transcription initiation factor IIF auxiliary subunit